IYFATKSSQSTRNHKISYVIHRRIKPWQTHYDGDDIRTEAQKIPMKKNGWLIIILLITTVVMSPVIRNDFINRDDPSYISDNALVKVLSVQSIGKIFSTAQYQGDYHPITLLAFTVEYTLFGDKPQGYHAVSLLLH